MQFAAISMDSASSAVRVPSVTEVLRKSMMANARRCLVVWVAWRMVRGLTAAQRDHGRRTIFATG